jgi:hypothetical protein
MEEAGWLREQKTVYRVESLEVGQKEFAEGFQA